MRIKGALAAVTTAALVAAVAAVQLGCDEKGIHAESAHQTMGAYAKGYNVVIGEVPDVLESYFAHTPPDGPTLESLKQNKHQLCSHDFSQMEQGELKKAFGAAKTSANKDLEHLGPLSDELWTASMEISALRDAYCKYLQAEDFNDDKGEAAKGTHPKWVAAAEKYKAAQARFEEALDKVEDAQTAQELEKHGKDKNYGYWFRKFNSDAKRFVNRTESEPQSVAQHFSELEPSYNDLQAFTLSKGSDLNTTFKSYQDSSDNFFAEAKKLNRAIGEAKDENARAKVVADSFETIVNRYNSLVSWHSSLTQLEGHDMLK